MNIDYHSFSHVNRISNIHNVFSNYKGRGFSKMTDAGRYNRTNLMY
jgi:hypothetical protein